MKLALFDLGDLRLVSPQLPKRSKRIILDYLEKYKYEDVDKIDINSSFIEGFYYAKALIGDMLEEERDSQEREIQAKEDLEKKIGNLIGYIDFLRNTAQGKRKSLNLMENLIKALFPDCEREIRLNKECIEEIRKYAVINRRRREDGKKM